MQSIITKYHGPGNIRGARISASSTSGMRRFYSWDHALSADTNHLRAAQAFAEGMEWGGHWVGGAYNDQGAQIWVREWEDKRDSFTVNC